MKNRNWLNRNATIVLPIITLFTLIWLQPWDTHSAHAETLLLRLNQMEYSSPARLGILDFIEPDSLPFGIDPAFTGFFTGVWIEASWEKICTSNIFLFGGTANGWLLGPVIGPEVNAFYNAFFPRDASAAYIVLIGASFGTIGGSGTRIPCSGSATPVAFGIIYIFILDSPIGNHVADLFYITELVPSGQWYKLTL